jgi:hypothetical protein
LQNRDRRRDAVDCLQLDVHQNPVRRNARVHFERRAAVFTLVNFGAGGLDDAANHPPHRSVVVND